MMSIPTPAKRKLFILYVTSGLIISACEPQANYSSREQIPIGTNLNYNLISKSERIVIIDTNDVILLYDINTDAEFYSPTLLFFRDNFLIGSCYCPFNIFEVKNKSIVGFVNKNRQLPAERFECQMPEGYSMSMMSGSDNFKGSRRLFITRHFRAIGDSVELIYRKGADSSDYRILLSIEQIYYDSKSAELFIYEEEKSGYIVQYVYKFENRSDFEDLIESFYQQAIR